MKKHEKLIEENSQKDTTIGIKETEQNINQTNNIYFPLNHNKNPNYLYLIFRNQLSNDITLEIDKTKIKTINELINLLLSKLKVSKSENIIRLFFKGRPLKKEEKIADISNS